MGWRFHMVHLKREQELELPICYIRLKADATVMNTCSQLEKCWLKVEICQGRAGWGCCWQAGAPLSGGRYLSTGFRPPTIIIVKKSCRGRPSQCLGFISYDRSSLRHHVQLEINLLSTARFIQLSLQIFCARERVLSFLFVICAVSPNGRQWYLKKKKRNVAC